MSGPALERKISKSTEAKRLLLTLMHGKHINIVGSIKSLKDPVENVL